MQVHTCYRTARGVKSLSTAESVQSPFFLLMTRRECSLVCKGPLNSRLCADSLAERFICRHVQPEQRDPFAGTSPLPYCALTLHFGIVNKAEIDVFLELSCFFNDAANVGNLISGSSAFSKNSLNIWNFMVHTHTHTRTHTHVYI